MKQALFVCGFRPTAGPRFAPNMTSSFERPQHRQVAGSLRRIAVVPICDQTPPDRPLATGDRLALCGDHFVKPSTRHGLLPAIHTVHSEVNYSMVTAGRDRQDKELNRPGSWRGYDAHIHCM